MEHRCLGRLGSDRSLRWRLFTRESFEHPAKLHLHFVRHLAYRYLSPGQTVLDPMVGIGSTGYLAMVGYAVIGLEIEERWIAHAKRNAARVLAAAGMFAGSIQIFQHDARQPWPVQADAVLFSPPYSCRFTANAQARVGTLPHRIRALGNGAMGRRWQQFLEQPSPGASGAQRFFYGDHPAQIGHLRGDAYWQAMRDVYANAHAALPGGGVMIVVLKDHVRKRQRVPICDQTATFVSRLGFRLIAREARELDQLSLWQRRRRESGELVIDTEEALIFCKDAA